MDQQIDIFGNEPTPQKSEQFKLVRLQVFNWGTFSNLVDIDVAQRGFLFVGPSGAGKSTLLDAHSALMMPSGTAAFNLAAQGEGGKSTDRNLMTYVRGAWAQESNGNGDVVQKYLRAGTTWSALAETYQSEQRTVTLAHVLWVKGHSTDRSDVKKVYLVVDRAFAIPELQPFADKEFDLKLVRALPGVHVHDTFAGYSERFRRNLGIEQDSALRLLHKTQSAKNLGDINDFLREFTLEPPKTFEIAQELVTHFQALRETHAKVVDAREQIEVLSPARDAYTELLGHRAQLAGLQQSREHLAAYTEQTKAGLLRASLRQLHQDIEAKAEEVRTWQEQEAQAQATLQLLEGKRNGAAQMQIALCETQLKEIQTRLREIEKHQPALQAVCDLLDHELPHSAVALLELQQLASQMLSDLEAQTRLRDEERTELNVEKRQLTTQLRAVQNDLIALSKRRSNIPSRQLEVRTRLCEALKLDETDLPFAGELIDVREAEQAWKGAAERVLHDFATHLLVPKAYHAQAKRLVNGTHWGVLVKLFDAEPVPQVVCAKPGTLATKLTYSDHPLSGWVRQEVCARFDHACVDSVEDFQRHRRAVTREGLVKSNDFTTRKDDRSRIDNRSEWILGGDTRAKVASLQDEHDRLDQRLGEIAQALEALSPSREQTQQRHLTAVAQLHWEQIDLDRVVQERSQAETQLMHAKAAVPDREELDQQIAEKTAELQLARETLKLHAVEQGTFERHHQERQKQLDRLKPELLRQALSAEVGAQLKARFDALAPELVLDKLDRIASQVKDDLIDQEQELNALAQDCRYALVSQLRAYMLRWPAQSANLQATEDYTEEFLALLAQVEAEGLPQLETQFMAHLQEHGTKDMQMLSKQLEAERKDIRERMEAVNESLKKTAFNAGTYLVIEPRDKSIPAVMELRQQIKVAVSNYLSDSTPQDADERFSVLHGIVKRLESQEEADKQWRALCLDVRRHVDFTIREIGTAGEEIDAYRSGAGKSGGQRQKLTATILAAALRYQLGGRETGVPKYSTVFMDEAFDKADAAFTDLAMKVFETFGFQLVVATPLKSVMTLEPYIGGACFVHIEDRKHSRILPLAYLEAEKKLDFSTMGVDLEAESAL